MVTPKYTSLHTNEHTYVYTHSQPASQPGDTSQNTRSGLGLKPGMRAYGFSVLFEHGPSVLSQQPNGRAARAKLAKAQRRCCFNTSHPPRRSALTQTHIEVRMREPINAPASMVVRPGLLCTRLRARDSWCEWGRRGARLHSVGYPAEAIAYAPHNNLAPAPRWPNVPPEAGLPLTLHESRCH